MRPIIIIVLASSVLFACDFRESNIINDQTTNLQWAKMLSPQEMEWEQARQYCSDLKLNHAEDWRLPTKSELETTINKNLVDENPESTERPFYGPFIVEKEGYVFSGTPVKGYKDAPYVMRLANGHIFNGKGYKAYARCVRDNRFK
jgi:hypothetical protein